MGKWGSGHVHKKSGAWQLSSYQTENRDGALVKVRRSKKLGEAKGVTQKHVNSLAAAEMGKIEARTITSDDMLVHRILGKELSAVLRKAQGCVPQPCAASSRFGDNTSKAHFGTNKL